MFDYLQYLQPFLRDIREFEAIGGGMDPEARKAEEYAHQSFYNQFVLQMNETTLTRWERLFKIYADPYMESLIFRKNRLIGRFTLRPRFTKPYLVQVLDRICGENKYIYAIHFNVQALEVDTVLSAQEFAELMVTLRIILPADMAMMIRRTVTTDVGGEKLRIPFTRSSKLTTTGDSTGNLTVQTLEKYRANFTRSSKITKTGGK